MKIKAYHVQEDCEATCCIVFDTNGASARRRGASELGVEWESIEFCRRARWADRYADRGDVPPQAMIEQGWWLTCGCCGNRIEQDLIDDPDDDCAPVYVGNWVYYNAAHHDSEVAEIKERRDTELAVRAEAEAKFPGIEVVRHFEGKGGNQVPGVAMRVPGLAGTADWQRGADFVSVEKRDEEAWHAYASGIKESAA